MKRSPILLLLTMLFPSHPTTLADTMGLGIRGGGDTLAKHEGYAAGELFP